MTAFGLTRDLRPDPAGIAMMETVAPDHGDPDGMLSGGDALRLMARAAQAAAARQGNGRMVMTRTDDVRFHQPIPVGHRLELSARIIHVRGGCITILVDAMAQPSTGGRRTLALSGYFQMTRVE